MTDRVLVHWPSFTKLQTKASMPIDLACGKGLNKKKKWLKTIGQNHTDLIRIYYNLYNTL